MTPTKSNANQQRKVSAAFLSVLFLSLGTAAPMAMAACDAPTLTVSIPDGNSANIDEMNRAQAAVSAYVAAGEAYIECVDAEQGRNQAERVRNETLDEMEKVAGAFNRQLRVFKKAQS